MREEKLKTVNFTEKDSAKDGDFFKCTQHSLSRLDLNGQDLVRPLGVMRNVNTNIDFVKKANICPFESYIIFEYSFKLNTYVQM